MEDKKEEEVKKKDARILYSVLSDVKRKGTQ